MDIEALVKDFREERAELLGLLAAIGDRWADPTPAPGWSIRDQITHLAWFDQAASRAIMQPLVFLAELERARQDPSRSVTNIADQCEQYSDADLVRWLSATGSELAVAATTADATKRIPWYGPQMSLASCVTARIMETWAHTQDIYDAIGQTRTPSPNLHHVAFIGWRALANSFATHGLPVPSEPIRVELGEISFGPPDASNRVTGSLLDFCLLVTRRRNVADTDLIAHGPVATQWLPIAQAFAGPPGPSRAAGFVNRR